MADKKIYDKKKEEADIQKDVWETAKEDPYWTNGGKDNRHTAESLNEIAAEHARRSRRWRESGSDDYAKARSAADHSIAQSARKAAKNRMRKK